MFPYFFMVVKMVLDALYDLIVLMPFSCHKDDVSGLCECAGSLYRRCAVLDP